MDPNDSITLRYFPLNGRGVFIRCMLEVSKIPYTNKVIPFEEWGKMEKPSNIFEYGFLPVLEYNGKFMSQSGAIVLFLAKKLELYGSNDWEAYLINEIMATKDDFMPELGGLLFSRSKISDEEADKQIKNLNECTLPWILSILESKFVNRKGKYWVGDKVSVADIFAVYIHYLLFNKALKGALDEVAKKYAPKLLAHAEAMKTNELKDYFVNGSFYQDAPL